MYLEWIRRIAWKKLVILSNSTPVATWTLSSWRDFRNKFHGFSTVFVAYNVCSVVLCFLFVFVCFVAFDCVCSIFCKCLHVLCLRFQLIVCYALFYHTIVNLCLYYTVCNVVTEANGIVFKFYGRRKYCNYGAFIYCFNLPCCLINHTLPNVTLTLVMII